MRAGSVITSQVLGQQPSQMVLIDDHQSVKSSRRRAPVILSQITFARGARGGLAAILMPSAVNTASKELMNWPARSLSGT